MSDEDSDVQDDGQAETEEEKYLPAGTDLKSDVSIMYNFLARFKRPSLTIDEAIPMIEERLNNWLEKGKEEGLSDTTLLSQAADIASSLAWFIENGGNERPPKYFEDLRALKITLYLMLDE
jgi:hypothetical protein